MDIARSGLGVGYPTKISSMNGRYMFDDDQETANTQMSLFEFPNPQGGGDKKTMLQFEVRHWMSNDEGELASGDGAIGISFTAQKVTSRSIWPVKGEPIWERSVDPDRRAVDPAIRIKIVRTRSARMPPPSVKARLRTGT